MSINGFGRRLKLSLNLILSSPLKSLKVYALSESRWRKKVPRLALNFNFELREKKITSKKYHRLLTHRSWLRNLKLKAAKTTRLLFRLAGFEPSSTNRGKRSNEQINKHTRRSNKPSRKKTSRANSICWFLSHTNLLKSCQIEVLLVCRQQCPGGEPITSDFRVGFFSTW